MIWKKSFLGMCCIALMSIAVVPSSSAAPPLIQSATGHYYTGDKGLEKLGSNYSMIKKDFGAGDQYKVGLYTKDYTVKAIGGGRTLLLGQTATSVGGAHYNYGSGARDPFDGITSSGHAGTS